VELAAGGAAWLLLEKGKTVVFGRGRNPINWVAASDVAQLVDPEMCRR
jgi:hypothetical protein